MKTSWLHLLACCVLLIGASSGRAQDTADAKVDSPCAVSEPTSRWLAGADLVALKPHFTDKGAFSLLQADGVSLEDTTVTNFEYDFALSPRVWLEYRSATGIGLRTQFWQFDQAANTESASPPANGFGQVTPPEFGNVDISSNIPSERFTASSGLKTYYVDIEATKRGSFSNWQLVGSAGLRYGGVKQDYRGELRSGNGTLLGLVDARHGLEGIGPTLALETVRAVSPSLAVFALARGSLLFGTNTATFEGGEDLDLLTPFHTSYRSSQDHILPIGELQLGGEWYSPQRSWGQWFARGAFEAQLWNGVGSADSPTGNLGFVGFSAGLGFAR